jgi:excisionase family DNA binding protein
MLPLEQVKDALKQVLVPMLEGLKQVPPQECFSIRQAAVLMGLSPKHIRRAVQKGELGCSNVGGEKRSTLRITRRDIDAWLDATRIKHAPARPQRDALVEKYFPKRKKRPGAAA